MIGNSAATTGPWIARPGGVLVAVQPAREGGASASFRTPKKVRKYPQGIRTVFLPARRLISTSRPPKTCEKHPQVIRNLAENGPFSTSKRSFICGNRGCGYLRMNSQTGLVTRLRI